MLRFTWNRCHVMGLPSIDRLKTGRATGIGGASAGSLASGPPAPIITYTLARTCTW